MNSYHKGMPGIGWGGTGPKAMEDMHEQMHADGAFQEGQEHKHWEPKR